VRHHRGRRILRHSGDTSRGLARLEYRGYDSAGIALVRPGQTWRARCAAGTESVAALRVECERAPAALVRALATPAGHPRRARSAKRAPHLDCSGNIAIIHNGIIENHTELQVELEAKGHTFTSVTDSEVLAHLMKSPDPRDSSCSTRCAPA